MNVLSANLIALAKCTIAALIFFCNISLAIQPSSSPTDSENTSTKLWYSVYIAGQKVGFSSLEREVLADVVTSKTTTYMEIKRAGTKLIIKSVEQNKETLQGEVLSFYSKEQQGKQVVIIQGVVSDNKMLDLTINHEGRVSYRQKPWNPKALLIEGQRLKSLEMGLKQGTKYELQTYIVSAMQPAVLNVLVGPTHLVKQGVQTLALTKVLHKVQFGQAQLTMQMMLTSLHDLTNMSMDIMGSKMELKLVTQKIAQAASESPAQILFQEPSYTQASFFENTLTLSPQRISDKQTRLPIKYSISSTNKQIKFVNSAEQQVSFKPDGSISVQVTPIKAGSGTFPYTGNKPELIRHLTPNLWVQNDNSQLKSVAQHAVGDNNKTASAAAKLELFVRNYITTKNLSVGYASALDVLKNRIGDCTEHALLLTALMKSIGIPARVATGVVYTQEFSNQSQIFVPHAWTQAYISGRWVSYDAAIGRFGSGHILLSTGNGDPISFINTVNSIGNFKITDVVSR